MSFMDLGTIAIFLLSCYGTYLGFFWTPKEEI